MTHIATAARMINRDQTARHTPALSMYAAHIQELATITLPRELSTYGFVGQSLTLQRIWPQSDAACALAYMDAQGKAIVGHWFGSVRKLDKYMKQANQHAVHPDASEPIALPELGLVLLPSGLDPELPGLAELASQPHNLTLVHRPGKRAVVRVELENGHNSAVHYVKVVRPHTLAALASTLQQVGELTAKTADRPFTTPAILHSDARQGTLHLASLPGTPLIEWYDRPDLYQAAHAAGAALAALHRLPVPPNIAPHAAHHEVATLEKWFTRLGTIAPALAHGWQHHLRAVSSALQTSSPHAPVLLHRDFYDKQVFISHLAPDAPIRTANPAVGILDFDTLATGEAALDLANALVHFELRAHLGTCTVQQQTSAKRAFLTGYAPSAHVEDRLSAYADATRLRLACVYACRPQAAWVPPALLSTLGAPLDAPE